MVILDILAPIFLLVGLKMTTSSNATLLNNFEIVATSLIAYIVFKEVISKRLMISIILITIGCSILSFDGSSFNFNLGSILVLLASICWGLENNCTRIISNKDTNDIVIIKGIFSGNFSILLALFLNKMFPLTKEIIFALLLGFVSYGLSINFYVLAQRSLGASKTSAYYSTAPFLGVILSFILLKERPSLNFYIALIFIIISTYIMVKDTIKTQHTHLHKHLHSHMHRHGSLKHSHPHTHEHSHLHIHEDDGEKHGHSHNLEELEDDHNHIHKKEHKIG